MILQDFGWPQWLAAAALTITFAKAMIGIGRDQANGTPRDIQTGAYVFTVLFHGAVIYTLHAGGFW